MQNNIDRLYKALCAPFPPKAIRWRAQQVYDGKALALAYVDARDVQERLDKVIGFAAWQCDYRPIGDNRVACGIGVFLGEDIGWVWKWDGAGETAVEGEKGAFSDSFKRAAVKWGVSRYLYDLGNTWVPCETRERNGKQQFKKFKEDPWNHVTMETVEIKKSMYEDLAYLAGERDKNKVKIRLLQVTESMGHTGIDSLAKIERRLLFDIQEEILKEVAAQQEMEQDLADQK